MATFQIAVKAEEARPKNVLRLITSGNFYRAYNHSAWYFTTLFADHYKVSRKYIKSLKQDCFYIGCPGERLLEFLGGQKYVKTELGYDITLDEDKIPRDENAYEEWKKQAKEMTGGRMDGRPLQGEKWSTGQLIQQIREWPIESKTILETFNFFVCIREQLSRRTENDGTLF